MNLFACCCFYCFYHDGLFVPVLFTWHGSEEEQAKASCSSGLSLLHLQMSEAPGQKILNRSPNIFAKKSLCVHDHRTIISTFCNFLLIPHSPVKAVAQASMVFPLHTLKICVDQRKKISLDQPKNIYIFWSTSKEVQSSSSLSTPHPKAGGDADGQDHEVLEHQNLKYNIEEKLEIKLKRDSELYRQNLISTEKSGLLELAGQSGQSKDLSQLRETVGQQKENT